MKRKLLSLLLTAAMLLSLGVTASAADGSHWAQSAADRWQTAGVIQGDDNGDLRLDDSMTRVELATVFANLLGLTEEAPNTYADLTGSEWYAPAILKCTAAGIMQGDGVNCNAGVTITRQETTVMTARALGIAPAAEADLAGFTDADDVADWAAPYVAAMAEAGIINGMGDGTVAPTADIDRASTMTLFDKAVAVYAGEPGEYDVSGSGIVIVAAAGVTLSGELEGSVLVAAGAQNGAVTLDTATVTGTVTVASNAEVTAKDSKLADVAVTAAGASVALTGKSEAETVTVAQSAEAANLTVEKDAKVDTVSAAAPDSAVSVAGTVTKVETAETAAGAAVTIAKDGKVDTVAAAAPDSTVSVAGTVTKVETHETATGAKVETEKGASIKEVVANAEGTTVTGEAKVDKVTANADNTAVSTPNTKVEAGKDTTGVTVGDKEVKPGSSTTTNSSGTGTKPNTSGGGSSGPSYTVVNDAVALKTAVANGGYIRLGADMELTEQIEVGNTVTLDLNGKTLTAKAYVPDGEKDCISAFKILSTGNMTLNDSGSTGKIIGSLKEGTAYSTTAVVSNWGTFVMNGGTIETTEKVYYAFGVWGPACKATINGGTIKSKWSTEGVAIGSNGTEVKDGVQYYGYTLTINGGAIVGGEQAMYLAGSGTTVIQNGTFEGGVRGIEIRSGTLTMNNGIITSASSANNMEDTNLKFNSGSTGQYTGTLVTGVHAGASSGAYRAPVSVQINGGKIKNITGGGAALCVVNEKAVPAEQDTVTVAVSSAATITGAVQQKQTGSTGITLTNDGAAWVFSADSLKAALVIGGSIKLGQDIELSAKDWTDSWNTENAEKTLTLDLNQKELTVSGNGSVFLGYNQSNSNTSSNQKGFKADYTIKNGTITANNTTNTTANFAVETGQKLTLDGVNGHMTVKGLGSGFLVRGEDATLIVKDSTITTTGVFAVSTNANDPVNYGVKIEVSGSEIKTESTDHDNCAICINVPSTVNITNSTIEGERQAVLIRAGDVKLTDCTITAILGDISGVTYYYSDTKWDTGNEAPFGAVVVGKSDRHQTAPGNTYAGNIKLDLSGSTLSCTTEVPEYSRYCSAFYAENISENLSVTVTGNCTVENDGQVVNHNGKATLIGSSLAEIALNDIPYEQSNPVPINDVTPILLDEFPVIDETPAVDEAPATDEVSLPDEVPAE